MVPHDPINVAEALFGLYTSVYLTFGVIVRVLTPSDASAAIPADISMARPTTSTALPSPGHSDESPSCDPLVPVAEPAGNPIECRPGAASD